MKRSKILSVCFLLLIAASCSSNTNNPATTTFSTAIPPHSILNQQTTSEPTVTLPPTYTSKIYTIDEAMMYEQDFEKEGINFPHELYGTWHLLAENDGNQVYCNEVVDFWAGVSVGNFQWTDYAVEFRGKIIEQGINTSMTIGSRIGILELPPQDVWAALDFQTRSVDIHTQNGGYSHLDFQTQENTWYTMRLEVVGNKAKLYINDTDQGNVENIGSTNGIVGISVSPFAKICIDDIRVWQLSGQGWDFFPSPINNLPILPKLESVTNNASTGDGGNAWGGHQARIVRTQDGVFTAYTIEGNGLFDRKWQLAWRQEDGTWPVIAEGITGKDPVNLLTSPEGTLYIIGWPNGIATIWSGNPTNGQIDMNKESIPGMPVTDWPYSSAGIDSSGNLCVLATQGGKPGVFHWACYLSSQKQWINKYTTTDYGFRYTYIFPNPEGGLSLVSSRDVAWDILGYPQPPNSFGYVFNAVGYWLTNDLVNIPPNRLFLIEELPTTDYPYPHLNAQYDAYIDTYGNMHILYRLQGKTTKGAFTIRHIVLSTDGTILANVQIPREAGEYARIFQDTKKRFWLNRLIWITVSSR